MCVLPFSAEGISTKTHVAGFIFLLVLLQNTDEGTVCVCVEFLLKENTVSGR
jgi:hypothetical protein